MENLNNYVDFWQYCNALSDITHLDIDEVIQVVRNAFYDINAGVITPELGFQRIEVQLSRKSHNYSGEGLKIQRARTRNRELPPSRVCLSRARV